MKIRRFGVSHTPRVGLGKCQQLSGRAWWCGCLGAIGNEGQLRCTPGRFKPLGRHRKIGPHRFVQIHQPPVGQALRPWAKQQPAIFKIAKVLAVHPHQVHRAVTLAAGSQLRLYPLHHLGRVGDLHMAHLNAIAGFDFLCGPGNVSVDGLATTPGVEIHRLAFGIIFNL